ncbi:MULTISPECIES: hypothetical protein [Muribaculum]|uniref:hypothetical protein n=1 Tax=Muribaculum TaxID=1918540 RepID=UPI000F497C1D|nr:MULTISPECIES: hypothetical protein [Muribaculum]MCX4279397.1 hypothetical protein [Muribaculum sp.]ROT09890.1 hypothetical protein EEL33_00400 [Muribaculaceae bacterium Isolate-037 (Harlan)]ROT12340.1 hypothetical protein EEL48_12225 [Muribaculaceae bacterium Isolate-102 (HZI)]RXE64992.1 hypothetical protein ED328_15205 [Muribaculaceae bacterium Isolate-001 (NCI)]
MDIQDTIDRITECAEAKGWSVHTSKNPKAEIWQFELSQSTKAGQDFNFSAEMKDGDPDSLIKSVREYYEGFDPDEEAYLWIGEDGHGRNGAPYHIRDIVADMEDAESMVLDLLAALEETDFDPTEE